MTTADFSPTRRCGCGLPADGYPWTRPCWKSPPRHREPVASPEFYVPRHRADEGLAS